MTDNTLPIGLEVLTSDKCPWYFLRNKFGLPNVDWCEVNLCGWASEPANTYSNIVYLIIGWLIWQTSLNNAQIKNQISVKIGTMTIIMGTFSLIYHASITYFFQLFDFLGMFLYLALLISINMRRLHWINKGTEEKMTGVITCFGMICVHFMRIKMLPYQSLVGILVFLLLITEYRISYVNANVNTNYKWFYWSLLMNGIGGIFSFLDVSRNFCPNSHILQGHAIWHFFTALGCYCAFKYYAQFKLELPK